MPREVLFPWRSPLTNVHTTMKRQSERVYDPVTKQWWYVELDSWERIKTAVRLCLVPSDGIRVFVIMKFNLYLKKDNIVLAVTSSEGRFSRSNRTSQCLMHIQFKDITDDVKLSMTFDDPILSADHVVNGEAILGVNNLSFLSFLKSGEFSDVIITVDGQEIKSHKQVLSWNSPYFYRMFESNLKESMKNKIDIVDFDYETINAMVNYMYTSSIPKISLELAKKLQIAADIYQIFGLKHLCEQKLILQINVQNAMEILLHADIYSVEKVKNRTIEFILSNWKDFKDKENYEALMTRPDLLRDLMIAKANEDSESDV